MYKKYKILARLDVIPGYLLSLLRKSENFLSWRSVFVKYIEIQNSTLLFLWANSGPETVSGVWIFHTKDMTWFGKSRGLYLHTTTQHRLKTIYAYAPNGIQNSESKGAFTRVPQVDQRS